MYTFANLEIKKTAKGELTITRNNKHLGTIYREPGSSKWGAGRYEAQVQEGLNLISVPWLTLEAAIDAVLNGVAA